MRALFLVLLLANILFFAWTGWVAPPPPSPGFATTSFAGNQSIRLVRESPLAQELSESLGGAGSGPANEALAAAQCVSIGPFLDRGAADAVVAQLGGLGFTSRPRSSTDEVWAGHWVRIPDLATAEDASNALTALKGLGATDAVIVTDDTPSNTVSLGVFSDQAKADEAVAVARRAGLSPVVTDRFRTSDVFWIDVDRGENAGLPRIEDLGTEPGRISRLQMRACPVVEPATQAGASTSATPVSSAP